MPSGDTLTVATAQSQASDAASTAADGAYTSASTAASDALIARDAAVVAAGQAPGPGDPGLDAAVVAANLALTAANSAKAAALTAKGLASKKKTYDNAILARATAQTPDPTEDTVTGNAALRVPMIASLTATNKVVLAEIGVDGLTAVDVDNPLSWPLELAHYG